MILNTQEIYLYLKEQILVLGAMITALGAFWVKVMRPVLKWGFKTAEIISKLDKIVAEVSPNGGSSLKDVVNRIEANQIKTEERVRILLLDSADGIWESDKNGLCVWANRTLLNMMDLELNEILGNGWIVAIPEEQRTRVVTEWRRAVNDKREFRLDFPYQAKSGKIINVSCKASPMIKIGKICGWIGIAKVE